MHEELTGLCGNTVLFSPESPSATISGELCLVAHRVNLEVTWQFAKGFCRDFAKSNSLREVVTSPFIPAHSWGSIK